MATLLVASLLVLFAFASGFVTQKDPPTFSSSYTVKGVLRLPYAELEEPIQVWFDGPNKRSRIDYYNGLYKTMQRGDAGDHGATYTVAFVSTHTSLNKLSCFGMNGTADGPVGPQSIFPDTTNFTYKGEEMVNGVLCAAWVEVVVVGGKTSTYTLWVAAAGGAPVRYQMMGYDSLIGSHYDKYIIDYDAYQAGANIPDSVFDTGMTCTGFPGPGAEHRVTMNPLQEFVHRDDSHTDLQFTRFRHTHAKAYASHAEHTNRQHVFRQNLRYINSKNRAGLSFRLAVNHMADRTGEEMRSLRGFRRTVGYSQGVLGQPFHKERYAAPPAYMDWRLYGAVTPVKDQAVCGSCWSFGTTGTLEGAYFLKTGKQVRFSQQQLMDCSWGEGNNGCDGGEDFRAYTYIMKNGGLSTEDLYGHYMAVDGMCHAKTAAPVLKMSGYVNVTSGDLGALKLALANHGPVSVAIDASHKSLVFYANGVYYEPQCGNTPDDLDHAVLAVGYGELDGQAYWLVKNSWSTYWGNDGYVLFAQKDNNCGVATTPTFPVLQ